MLDKLTPNINYNMKKLSMALIFIGFLSCDKKVDPDIKTLVLSDSYSNSLIDRAIAQRKAAYELFHLYGSSTKESSIYEVISRWGSGDFVVSYHPKKQLLSTATEICSGWDGQYKGVSMSQLEKLGQAEILISKYDSILTRQVDNWDHTIQKSNHKCAN